MEPAPTVFERMKILQLQIAAVTDSLDDLMPLDDLDRAACIAKGQELSESAAVLAERIQRWGR